MPIFSLLCLQHLALHPLPHWYSFLFFLGAPWSLQDLSSLMRDWTHILSDTIFEFSSQPDFLEGGMFVRYLCVCVCVCVRVPLCPTLCNPMDCNPPGSRDLCGISQARILEWVAISYPKGSAWPRDWIHVSCSSCIGRLFLYHCTIWEAQISVMGKSNISL